MRYRVICYTYLYKDNGQEEGVGRMNQKQKNSEYNQTGKRHTASQKYFLNRMKYKVMLIVPVFGFLFGTGTLKSFEAEPMMFILVLCVIGSLAEFIPPGWEKASAKEEGKQIDWNGFIKTILGYAVVFVVGLGIGFMFRTR